MEDKANGSVDVKRYDFLFVQHIQQLLYIDACAFALR